MFNRMRAEGVAPSAVTLLGPSPAARLAVLVAAFLLVCTAYEVASDGPDHRYKAGDPVPLYANKIGPFHNPSETYRYFDLPFCSPAHITEKKEALGEALNGDRLVSAPYKLDFLKDKDSETVCKKTLSKEEIAKFRDAVNKDFYFQMYYDDLPIWGFIGKVDKEGKLDPSEYKYYLYKHLHFEISYNKYRVVEINAQTDPNAVIDVTETDDKELFVANQNKPADIVSILVTNKSKLLRLFADFKIDKEQFEADKAQVVREIAALETEIAVL